MSSREGAAAPITDRVNVEPAILNGMTASEAKLIGLAAFVLSLLLASLLVAATGFLQCLLVTLFLPLVILWFASKYLAKIKRNRPDGYYGQAMHLWMSRRGLTSCRYLQHDGYWSLGRTLPFGLTSPFKVTSNEPPLSSPLSHSPSNLTADPS
ncbi:TIGR03750 family conjugal transfer protein [Diaphorobacter sp. HDW4A]|nr:TIGR03750 family conjugal transfer protein [Diaphorobacter sp. HDW4A]